MQCQESQETGQGEVNTQDDEVHGHVLLGKFPIKETIHVFPYRTLAIIACQVFVIAIEIVVEISLVVSDDGSVVVVEQRCNHTLVNVVARGNPVRNGKEACQKLRSHNQTREKVVESNEHTREDLGSGHWLKEAHKGLAKIGVNRDIESKEPLLRKDKWDEAFQSSMTTETLLPSLRG